MSLPRAYCVQTGSVVDITTARRVYFAQPEPRRELDFRCASAVCRAENHQPVILGINYNKIPGIDKFVQQPHFRTKKGSTHHNDCPYVEYQTAIDELDDEYPPNPPISGVKRSSLVEIFAPVTDTDFDDIDAVDTEVLDGVKHIKDKKRRIEAIKDLLKKIPNRTRRLHEAAQCFIAMTKDQRKIYPFQIEGYARATYATHFKWAGYCDVTRKLPCIYYGRVNVKYWRSKTPFYTLRFHPTAKDNNGNERTVTIKVPEELIHHSRDRAFYETVLSTVAGVAGHNVLCFVYGTASLAEKTPDQHIDITIDHLHNLDISLPDDENDPS